MSIITKMYVDDKEFIITNYHISFYQPVDYTGRPQAKPQGGLVRLQIETRGNTIFEEWAKESQLMKYVKIVQSSVTLNSKTRLIELYDTHCIELSTNFNHVGTSPLITSMVLSAGIFVVNEQPILEKPWKISDLTPVEPTTSEEEQLEPRIKDCYYTNLDGEEVFEAIIGDEIFLVLKTENMVGETIDINLSDAKRDFEYQGKRLKEDIIKEYKVTKDNEKIKVKILLPQAEPIALKNS